MSTANPSRLTGRSFRLVCPPEQMPQVASLLRAQGYEFEPEPFSPFCRRLLCEPRPLGSSLAAFFGYIYIQDRSSMLPPPRVTTTTSAPRVRLKKSTPRATCSAAPAPCTAHG